MSCRLKIGHKGYLFLLGNNAMEQDGMGGGCGKKLAIIIVESWLSSDWAQPIRIRTSTNYIWPILNS